MTGNEGNVDAKGMLSDNSPESLPNSLNLNILRTDFDYSPFEQIVGRMKIVSEDELPDDVEPESVMNISERGDEQTTKIDAYYDFVRSRREPDENPGLIEQYYSEASEYFRKALEAIPTMKQYAPVEKISLAAKTRDGGLGRIEIHNFVQPLLDDQLRAIGAATDFLYQFFGERTYEILKEIIIAPLGPGDKPFDAEAPAGQVSASVPGVLFLGPEVCGTPNEIAATGQFNPGPKSQNFLPVVLIHEFAHLLHFSGDEVDPDALLRFSKAVGWDIDSIPEYPKKMGEQAPGYRDEESPSSSPTEYGKSHPYETLAETTSVLAPSQEVATKLGGTRDAWLKYIEDIGYPSPAASLKRPTYDCEVTRLQRALPLPENIYLVR